MCAMDNGGNAVVGDAMVLWRVAGSACCALVLCSVFCSITVRSPRGVSGSHMTVQCRPPSMLRRHQKCQKTHQSMGIVI